MDGAPLYLVIKTRHKFETIKQIPLTSLKMSAAKHICDTSGTSFSERKILNRHLDIHTSNNFQCLICSKSFTTQGYLRKKRPSLKTISTLRLMTTKMSDFNVASVKHIFCKSGFTKHITTKHIDFMYGCLYCEKSFSRREYYKIHVEKCSNKTTENRKFGCDQCERTMG